VFVPLIHNPGEAQVDLGSAEIILAGQDAVGTTGTTAKVALFVMTLPYSDAIFGCVTGG
jgi:hypothetical protein